MGGCKLQKITQRLPFGYKNRRRDTFFLRKVGKSLEQPKVQQANPIVPGKRPGDRGACRRIKVRQGRMGLKQNAFDS
jgi:hypothetical protein